MYEIKAHDTLPPLTFQLMEKAGTPDEGPLDTSGCQVRFFFQKAGQQGFNESLVVMTDELTGQGYVSWVPEDTAVSVDTDCRGEFQVTRTDGRQFTVPAHEYLQFRIRADLNKA